MRIAIISDVHVDNFESYDKTFLGKLPNKDLYDIMIVAGDISSNPQKTLDTMILLKEEIYPKIPYFVSGNHDRYGKTFLESTEIFTQHPGYLNRNIVHMGNQRILGCTLWYNIDKAYIRGYPDSWIDFHYIKNWKDIRNEHMEDIKFLKDNLKDGDIVVTHMLPLVDLISPHWQENSMNKYFLTDCKHILESVKPKLWIHGHSHQYLNEKIGETLFIRNPWGYDGEHEREKLNMNFIIINSDLLK